MGCQHDQGLDMPSKQMVIEASMEGRDRPMVLNQQVAPDFLTTVKFHGSLAISGWKTHMHYRLKYLRENH